MKIINLVLVETPTGTIQKREPPDLELDEQIASEASNQTTAM